MKKLMERNAVIHAVVWIAIYVAVVNIGGVVSEAAGIEESATGVLLILLSLILLRYLARNKWIEKFGIKRISNENFMSSLMYVPLIFLALLQFVNGIIKPINPTGILIIFLMMTGVGFLEELIFRGFLMQAIWKKSGIKRAILISGITFGLGHIVNLFRGYGYLELTTQIIAAAAIGIVLAMLAASTGNIVPGIMFHIVFNISGSISNPAESSLEMYVLALMLVTCVIYSLYLVRYLKGNISTKNREDQSA